MNNYIIEKCWREILREIGENEDRPGLKDTPKRIAKMYAEIFRGYDLTQKPQLTIFDNEEDGIKYNQIIVDKGKFYSQCEHHGVPFAGSYFFGYIPDKKIVGLSKIARLVDFYSAKLQVQERLGEEIINEIETVLQPKGSILILKASHLCKQMRGVRKEGEMVTSVVRGVFTKDYSAKEEFLKLINL